MLGSRDFEILSTMEDEKHSSFCICAEQSKSVKFNIKPNSLGPINITVSVSDLVFR